MVPNEPQARIMLASIALVGILIVSPATQPFFTEEQFFLTSRTAQRDADVFRPAMGR